MICDQLSQWHRYSSLSPRFANAFAFLETVTADTPTGRQALDGDNLFALVQKYTTRSADKAQFEAHRKYIDIQYLIAGRETILWAPLSKLTAVTQPYDVEKECALFAPVSSATPVRMNPGQFAILFPED